MTITMVSAETGQPRFTLNEFRSLPAYPHWNDDFEYMSPGWTLESALDSTGIFLLDGDIRLSIEAHVDKPYSVIKTEGWNDYALNYGEEKWEAERRGRIAIHMHRDDGFSWFFDFHKTPEQCWIDYWRVIIPNKGQGLGRRLFEHQINALRDGPFWCISLGAGRGKSKNMPYQNGYYTWARFGFDGTDNRQKDDRPIKLPEGYTSVAQLMLAPGGPEWWKRHGQQYSGVFDLRSGSISWQVWNQYVASK